MIKKNPIESFIKYMAVTTFTDPVPPSASWHRHIVIQYRQIPIGIIF